MHLYILVNCFFFQKTHANEIFLKYQDMRQNFKICLMFSLTMHFLYEIQISLNNDNFTLYIII